jgi:hypothetical protein
VVGKLGGLFQRKKANADAPVAQPASDTASVVPAGDVPLMTVSSELVSVSTNAVSADAFSVPAGFKKLESKTL